MNENPTDKAHASGDEQMQNHEGTPSGNQSDFSTILEQAKDANSKYRMILKGGSDDKLIKAHSEIKNIINDIDSRILELKSEGRKLDKDQDTKQLKKMYSEYLGLHNEKTREKGLDDKIKYLDKALNELSDDQSEFFGFEKDDKTEKSDYSSS